MKINIFAPKRQQQPMQIQQRKCKRGDVVYMKRERKIFNYFKLLFRELIALASA